MSTEDDNEKARRDKLCDEMCAILDEAGVICLDEVVDADIDLDDDGVTRVLTLFVRVDDTPGRVESITLPLRGYDRAASEVLCGRDV
jgi:hypothetical protein